MGTEVDNIFGVIDDEKCIHYGVCITDPEGTYNFLSITMPCKHVFTLKMGDRIPDGDIPCTCGDPKHWFWKVIR